MLISCPNLIRPYSRSVMYCAVLLISFAATAGNVSVSVALKAHEKVTFSGIAGNARCFYQVEEQLSAGHRRSTLIFLDRELHETARNEVVLGRGEKFVRGYADSTGVYSFFLSQGGAYTILYFDGSRSLRTEGVVGSGTTCGGIRGWEGQVLAFLTTGGEQYLLGADLGKKTPVFINVNHGAGEVSVSSVEFLGLRNEFGVVYSIIRSKERHLHLLILDKDLTASHDQVLDGEQKDTVFRDGVVSCADTSAYMICGSYCTGRSKTPSGIFVIRLKTGTATTVRYAFKGSSLHLSAVNGDTAGNATSVKIRSGDGIIYHAFRKDSTAYVLVAEKYEDVYTSDIDNDADFHREFEGYLFNGLLVAEFDDSLNCTWEHSWSMHVFSTGQEWVKPAKQAKVLTNGGETRVLYCNDFVINDMVLSSTGTELSHRSIDCKPSDSGSDVHGIKNARAALWTDRSVLFTGTLAGGFLFRAMHPGSFLIEIIDAGNN